jgi:hypothetical protein
MTYTVKNFPTKKALREAIAAGDEVRVYEPGGWPCKTDGKVYLEGPHSPKPHTWYATAEVVDGLVVKIK